MERLLTAFIICCLGMNGRRLRLGKRYYISITHKRLAFTGDTCKCMGINNLGIGSFWSLDSYK